MHYRAYQNWRWGDPELQALPILCDRGKPSIDVGSFWGIYGYFMGRFSESVILVEPNPRARTLLRTNLGNRVHIIEAALSAEGGGTARMRIPDLGDDEGIALGTLDPNNALPAGRPIQEIEVPLKTLDEISPPNTGFIKIDVEGHEGAVLRGSLKLLSKTRPNFVIEAEERHHPGAVETVVGLLKQFDYRCYFFHGGKMHRFETFIPRVHQNPGSLPSGPYTNNFMFSTEQDAIRLERRFGLRT
jgi:FkbM family methyltransferase